MVLGFVLQVETRTLDEVREVLACRGAGVGRVTRVMLDNMVTKLPGGSMDTSMLEEAVQMIGGQLETEVRGTRAEVGVLPVLGAIAWGRKTTVTWSL